VDEGSRRRTHSLAGLAALAALVLLIAASFLVARWAGGRVGLEEGLALVGSTEPEQRLLGLAKLKGNPRAAAVFGRLLDDPDGRVRLTAALMLAGVAGPEASAPVSGAAGGDGDKGADFVERMRAWWRSEGRATYGGE
jgi:hypothetical protein